jgi:LacI family transcriptional regulator
MQKFTMKDLASRLGLSIATISRALNNSHETNSETRERVIAMAVEMGYTPDVYASNLRSRKSKTIGVIIPEITNSFFSQVIDGIETVARKQGYHVLIHLTHEDHEREVNLVRLLTDGRVDGVLMSVSGSAKKNDHINALKSRNIPVVLFDRIADDVKTLKIITNDYHCGFMAGKLLAKSGCKRISSLSFLTDSSVDYKRRAGVEDAAREYGLSYTTIGCLSDPETNLESIKCHLQSNFKPDGMFSPVEKLALVVYEACKTLDIKIPLDLKLVSFANMTAASLLQPPLTSIIQPAFEIGKQSCEALFKAIKNNFLHGDEEIILPSILVERESSMTCNAFSHK